MQGFTGYFSINGGERIIGWSAKTHNAAVRGTRRLFSGQGYRLASDNTGIGALILENGSGNRLVITVENN